LIEDIVALSLGCRRFGCQRTHYEEGRTPQRMDGEFPKNMNKRQRVTSGQYEEHLFRIINVHITC
jgi:hypothetical protein